MLLDYLPVYPTGNLSPTYGGRGGAGATLLPAEVESDSPPRRPHRPILRRPRPTLVRTRSTIEVGVRLDVRTALAVRTAGRLGVRSWAVPRATIGATTTGVGVRARLGPAAVLARLTVPVALDRPDLRRLIDPDEDALVAILVALVNRE